MEEWQIVPDRRRHLVSVYMEKTTRIYYIIDQKELNTNLNLKDEYDCIWARAVVKTSLNHFVFADDHYSDDGDLCIKDFHKKYLFVKTLDMNKIQTWSFENADPRLVYSTYKIQLNK